MELSFICMLLQRCYYGGGSGFAVLAAAGEPSGVYNKLGGQAFCIAVAQWLLCLFCFAYYVSIIIWNLQNLCVTR